MDNSNDNIHKDFNNGLNPYQNTDNHVNHLDFGHHEVANMNQQEKTNKQKFEEFMNDNVLPFQWENNNGISDEDDESFIYDLSDNDFSDESYQSGFSSYLDIPQRTRQNYSLNDYDSIQSDDSSFWELSSDDTSDDMSYNSNVNYDYDFQDSQFNLNQSIPFNGQYDNNNNGFTPDHQSFVSSFDNTQGNFLEQSNNNHPLINSNEHVYSAENPYILSIEQWKSINLQISRHFQLLVQVFLLSKKLTPESQTKNEIWKVLNEFYESFVSSNRNTQFPVQGIEHIKSLESLNGTDTPISEANFNKLLSTFSSSFSPKLRIELDRKPNKPPKKWTPAEDKLLAIGFDRYQKDWNSIQSILLPTKEIKSIKSRFKNKTSKKSRDNPIKQIYLRVTSPLTEYEMMMLANGVRMYGNNFDLIANMMPPRKPFWLKRTWKKMNSNRMKRNVSKIKIRKREEDGSVDEMSDQSDTDDVSSGSDNFIVKRKRVQ